VIKIQSGGILVGKIQWNDNLSINIPLIDDQHKLLIQRLDDVSSACEVLEGEGEIVRTLGFLLDYTDFHFSAEEKHMEENHFPGLEEQKHQHKEFVATLKNLVQDFEEEGSTRILAESINTFMINWLTTHIQGLDKQFGDFLEEKRIVITGDVE